jgi:hypothetical protein
MSPVARAHCLVAAGGEGRAVRLADPATGAFTHELAGHRCVGLVIVMDPGTECLMKAPRMAVGDLEILNRPLGAKWAPALGRRGKDMQNSLGWCGGGTPEGGLAPRRLPAWRQAAA